MAKTVANLQQASCRLCHSFCTPYATQTQIAEVYRDNHVYCRRNAFLDEIFRDEKYETWNLQTPKFKRYVTRIMNIFRVSIITKSFGKCFKYSYHYQL
jgi:hypothetical protein